MACVGTGSGHHDPRRSAKQDGAQAGLTSVNDVHNYLALVRFGFVGIALTGLGLIGCLVHRERMRLAVSFAVALTGCLLFFGAAARFHLSKPQPIVSAVVVAIGATGVLLAHRRDRP